jgi:RNA polymerase sigma-70 factor (ECF subfamily)
MLPSDERDLVLRVLRGDREAFGEIVQRHQQAVFRIAYRVLGDVHEAEDAAQEAFLRAYRFIDSFELGRPLGPWLHRITMNISLNRLETSRPPATLDDQQAAAAGPDPEVHAVEQDRHERLRIELDHLPPRYRAVIVLRHFEAMTYEEIAKQLRRPVSDVKSDLFRARKLLSERLRDLK